MYKICTDLSQSNKLIELGIDRKSSDMYYWCGEDLRIGGYKAQDDEYDISAWSPAALLSLMPFHLIDNNQRYAFSMYKGLNKDGETYSIRYTVFNTDVYLYTTEYYNNLVDACVEMIIKLKENGKI